MKNAWIKITTDNIPSDRLICEWKHPEYGVIKGSVIGGDDTEWIMPDDGRSAEIWLGEFTHYRKVIKIN